jgi:hypothetical protein
VSDHDYMLCDCWPCQVQRREEELEELRFVARRIWPTSWEDARSYEQHPMMFPLRCSVTMLDGRAGALSAMTCGEDLPGSWHQQQNGGARHWTAVCGEFEAR